jgi:hypothetical protein
LRSRSSTRGLFDLVVFRERSSTCRILSSSSTRRTAP